MFVTTEHEGINILDIKYSAIYCPYLPDLIFCVGVRSGGRLNKKDGLTRYGNSHVKDKTS